MRKSKKHQPEPFDVGDFLRPTDTDLRSALSSLLHDRPTEPEPPVISNPGLSLVRGEPAAEAVPELTLAPPATVTPELTLQPPVNLGEAILEADSMLPAGPKLTAPDTIAPASIPTAHLKPTMAYPETAALILRPAPSSISGAAAAPSPALTPGLNLPAASSKRQFAVRPAHLVEDGHSRAEQQVYAILWENATPEDEISRLITLGFASMGKLTGLSESNARINLRSLVQKLAVEEHTTYDCASSQGRTYRIFHPAEILRRRHAAGLNWVMRRTLAVVFVDPQTKLPLFLKTGSKSTPGPNIIASLILLNSARGHLQQYGPADPATVDALIRACLERAPQLTPEQLAAAIHHQALQAPRMAPAETIAYLLATVPAAF